METPSIEIRAARLYVSPRTRPLNRDEMETRGLSYLLKDRDCPQAGIELAAREMAALIWGPCNLVPVPGHTGDTSANLRLCRAIAANVQGGAKVFDILQRRCPVDSACQRHKLGMIPLTVEEHGIYRTGKTLMPAVSIWLVDNVTTTGTTLEACRDAIGFGRGLVFADAWQSIVLRERRKERFG